MNKSEQTKLAISQSLIEMLQRQPLDLITIKELTRKANVSRSAFYNNFKNIEDVLKYTYRNAHKEAFKDKFQNHYYQCSDEYIIDMIDFFDKNSHLLNVLFQWNLIDMIAKYNTHLVLEYVKNYDDIIIKNNPFYFICFTGATIFDMCILWLIREKQESKEELFSLIKYFQSLYQQNKK